MHSLSMSIPAELLRKLPSGKHCPVRRVVLGKSTSSARTYAAVSAFTRLQAPFAARRRAMSIGFAATLSATSQAVALARLSEETLGY